MSRERGGVLKGLQAEAALAPEAEAALAAEAVQAVQGLREALASLARREKSPRYIVTEDIPHGNVEDEGRYVNEPIPHGNVEDEGRYVNEPATINSSMPLQDTNDSLKKQMASISSTKRKRSTSIADTPNVGRLDIRSASSPTPVSPVKKRRKRCNTKKSYVWQHFSTGLKDKDPIATCNHCGKVYACDRSTHGTSTLWYHLRFLCSKEPLKGQDLQKKNQGTPKHTFSIEDCHFTELEA